MTSIPENPTQKPEDTPMQTLTNADIERIAVAAIERYLDSWQNTLIKKMQTLIDTSLAGYVRETGINRMVNDAIDQRIGTLEAKITGIANTLDVKLDNMSEDAKEAKEVAEMAKQLAQQGKDEAETAKREVKQIQADVIDGTEARPSVLQIVSKNLADLNTTIDKRHDETKAAVDQTFSEVLKHISDLTNKQYTLEAQVQPIARVIQVGAHAAGAIQKGGAFGWQMAKNNSGLLKTIIAIVWAIVTAIVYGDIRTP